MLLASLVLVLVSAFLHALWNALLKRARNMESVSAGILAVALILTSCAAFLLRVPAFPHRQALLWGLAAGICEGGYFIGLVQALERAPLGWSYTWMRGGAVVMVWPLTVLFLGEAIGPLSALCVGAVCLGLVFMGLSPGKLKDRSAILWALGAGACIAGFTLCYKQSLSAGAHPVGLFATSMAVSLPIQLAVRIRRRGLGTALAWPGQPGLVLAAGVLCTASFLLYLQALAMEGAGAVATLRNTSVVFAVLFSWILGERPPLKQWLGAALVAAGAAGLAWPR